MLYESNHITVRRKLMFLARSLLIGSKGLPVLRKGMNLKEWRTMALPPLLCFFFSSLCGCDVFLPFSEPGTAYL